MPSKELSGDQSNHSQLETLLNQIGVKAKSGGDWKVVSSLNDDGSSNYSISLEPLKPKAPEAE